LNFLFINLDFFKFYNKYKKIKNKKIFLEKKN